MNKENNSKAIIVIFGATGDLAKRKLFPSIYRLAAAQKISKDFAVIGVGRRPWSNEKLRDHVITSINEHADQSPSIDMNEFSEHFYYQSLDVENVESYQELYSLCNQLDDLYQTNGNRLFYLAMAPNFFGVIANHLRNEGLTNTVGWKRLVIEKPFGHNFESAKELNEQLRQTFREDEIYRIDHYLGKEMVQNIEVIRFANAIFEPLWNNRYISNIQITSSESLGVEERGNYYDKSGALRDMVQNHMLQMVALLAMEPPSRLTPDDIRSEKIKVFRAMRQVKEEEVPEYFVRGQYGEGENSGNRVSGYRQEPNVPTDSITETFVAGKLLIDNFRWAGVPFYIRTGKRMAAKATKIIVEFKDLPMDLYYQTEIKRPNLLVITIHPDEGITLHLNAKESTNSQRVQTTPIKLDYCVNCHDGINTPEAYERLLYDCMQGDTTYFTHWDEVSLTWQLVDPVRTYWDKSKAEFPNYTSGTMGPKEAYELIEKDGYTWWPIRSGEKVYE
ncbi:glucose-6-phosphate dehydrogenase [Bacillaceae bacterium S4-13-58]